MIIINIFYGLYFQPTPDIFKSYANTKRNEGIRRTALDAACSIHTTQKFSRPVSKKKKKTQPNLNLVGVGGGGLKKIWLESLKFKEGAVPVSNMNVPRYAFF